MKRLTTSLNLFNLEVGRRISGYKQWLNGTTGCCFCTRYHVRVELTELVNFYWQ